MHLLEAIPQCAALKWEYAFTDDFFSRASVRHVRYLTLVNCKNLDVNALADWLHSTRENVGDRRLTLLQDKCDFDATELAHLLKKEFLDDTQSREYQLLVYGNRVSLGGVRDEAVPHAAGDVHEVEASDHRAFLGFELCVTRLSKHNAERTSIVASTDGPKVWDFGTTHDLDRYLISNGITELLARSGLIANEMACSCRVPLHFRLRPPVRCDTNAPSNKSINNYMWKCSGENGCKFRLSDGSPMKVVNWFGDSVLVLKAILLLTVGKTDGEIHAALHVKSEDISRLRDIHARIMRLSDLGEELDVHDRLKKIYENMKLGAYRPRSGCNATFALEQ